jgi:hypothetical protein
MHTKYREKLPSHRAKKNIVLIFNFGQVDSFMRFMCLYVLGGGRGEEGKKQQYGIKLESPCICSRFK